MRWYLIPLFVLCVVVVSCCQLDAQCVGGACGQQSYVMPYGGAYIMGGYPQAAAYAPQRGRVLMRFGGGNCANGSCARGGRFLFSGRFR